MSPRQSTAFVTTSKGSGYLTVKIGRKNVPIMRIRHYTIEAQDKRDMRRLHPDTSFACKKIAQLAIATHKQMAIGQGATKRGARPRELAPSPPWPEHLWTGISVEHARMLSRVQGLRNASQPLQSWENEVSAPETETPLELVDGPVAFMPLPFQPTTGDETASHLMQLCPLGAGLTAGQPEVILAHTDHFRDLGTDVIPAAHLRGCQGQAIGGIGPWRRI